MSKYSNLSKAGVKGQQCLALRRVQQKKEEEEEVEEEEEEVLQYEEEVEKWKDKL